LDNLTRPFILEEIQYDMANDRLYLSNRLSERGRDEFLALLRDAAQNYDDGWLAEMLRQNGRLNVMEQRRKPKGGYTMAKVPVTAPETLAEGEFNRFYARGLCLRAIQLGTERLVVYRAKAVIVPRADSEAMIGTEIPANALLNDLRTHQGVDTALGLPNGPNSGLSVRLLE
jgi:hypothetical protein